MPVKLAGSGSLPSRGSGRATGPVSVICQATADITFSEDFHSRSWTAVVESSCCMQAVSTTQLSASPCELPGSSARIRSPVKSMVNIRPANACQPTKSQEVERAINSQDENSQMPNEAFCNTCLSIHSKRHSIHHITDLKSTSVCLRALRNRQLQRASGSVCVRGSYTHDTWSSAQL